MNTTTMLFKIIFLSIATATVLAQEVSRCCPGSNILSEHDKCSDGTKMKTLDCEITYQMPIDESNHTIDHSGNLILAQEILPPNQYCLTTLLNSDYQEYIICLIMSEKEEVTNISRNICTVLELISAFFIILTVIIYLMLPEILNLQNICILHSISGMASAYVTLSIINLIPGVVSIVDCNFLAHWMYFSFLYCFFWLNVICFNIWKEVVQPSCLRNISHWNVIYHVFGIGSPLLATSWLLIVQFGDIPTLSEIHPGIGVSRCWFKTVRETNIYFTGPIAVLLLINIIYFVWTIITLWYSSKKCHKPQILKYRLRMYLKLFFVMGITWVFEVLSTVFDGVTPKLWILTDILNALQGLIIFFILVVFRKKVKSLLANKKIYNWRLPAKWRNDKDSECEELEEDIVLQSEANRYKTAV